MIKPGEQTGKPPEKILLNACRYLAKTRTFNEFAEPCYLLNHLAFAIMAVPSAAPVVTHEPNCGCPTCAPWEPDAVVSQPLVERLRNSTKVIPVSQPEGTREFADTAEMDRHYICEIGRLFWGNNKDCYAASAVYRKVKSSLASPTPVVSGQAEPTRKELYDALTVALSEIAYFKDMQDWHRGHVSTIARLDKVADLYCRNEAKSSPPSIPKIGEIEQLTEDLMNNLRQNAAADIRRRRKNGKSNV